MEITEFAHIILEKCIKSEMGWNLCTTDEEAEVWKHGPTYMKAELPLGTRSCTVMITKMN
jgi:hypothetical protein